MAEIPPLPKRRLGKTDLQLSILGFGGSAIGNLHRPVPEAEAFDVIAVAFEFGVRYFDTAPLYGGGIGEHRMGHVLRRMRRDDYVISTKVGRMLRPDSSKTLPDPYTERLPFEIVHDYGYDAVRRSIEDSLQRLGISRVDIALIHDIDPYNHGDAYRDRFREAMEGAYPALVRLREEGTLGAIGIGVNNVDVCETCAKVGDFDCFLLAGRFSLLDQSALTSFLPLCEARGISVIVGAPFNSGILARGTRSAATYNYLPVPDDILCKVTLIEQLCDDHGISLTAAALQYPLRQPAVISVLPGMRSVEQAAICANAINEHIPAQFWNDLETSGVTRPLRVHSDMRR
jgi:D-threo-aldose 1-dehydrogenase